MQGSGDDRGEGVQNFNKKQRRFERASTAEESVLTGKFWCCQTLHHVAVDLCVKYQPPVLIRLSPLGVGILNPVADPLGI